MNSKKHKSPELLSPAGDIEKLNAAVRFGADAVYLAGESFGMRTASKNFSVEQLYAAADMLHSLGKKIYITINVLPHEAEYTALKEYLHSIRGAQPDALIVADLGVMALIKAECPEIAIHVSTQASITSSAAAKAYASLGATRLVLARELSLKEISAIRDALPDSVEIECFVHGSMCVSYSGRCLLSNALVGRDANHGNCAQPCRWNYTLMEEKRTDDRLPIVETPQGTFIMSSRDLCMIEHIPELIDAGIASFKLEGRVRSAYYAAVVTNTYRMAIDAYLANPEEYRFDPQWFDELCSVSHREYGTGFYFDAPNENANVCSAMGYIREKAYLAVAERCNELPECLANIAIGEGGQLCGFKQRNKLSLGETAELLTPGQIGKAFKVSELYDENGLQIESAPRPFMRFYTRVPFDIHDGDILRAGN